MKKLSKTDIHQLAAYAVLLFLRYAADRMMVFSYFGASLLEGLWYAGLVIIAVYFRRRDRLREAALYALLLGAVLGVVMYFFGTWDIFLFLLGLPLIWKAIFRPVALSELYPRKTAVLYAAIVLFALALQILTSYMDYIYYTQVQYDALWFLSLLGGTPWSWAVFLIHRIAQCAAVFLLSKSLPPAEETG